MPGNGEAMSGPSARVRPGTTGLTPGRLAHLQAELASVDRRLLTREFNWTKENLRQATRHDRKMRNCGMRPENALNPAWDWISQSPVRDAE